MIETPVTDTPVVETAETIFKTVRAQRLRRRLIFWTGFVVILVAGSLWAGLTKDPLNNRFFDDGDIIVDGPEPAAFEVEDIEELPPPLLPPDFETTTFEGLGP